MADEQEGSDDFLSFYREYARSGIHAAVGSLLTLFGLLSSVAGHWGFIGIGVAIYVLPPAYLYITQDSTEPDAANANTEESSGTKGSSTTANSDNRQEETTAETAPPESDTAERGSETPTGESGESSTTTSATTASERSTGWRWQPRDLLTDADLVDAVSAADGACAAGAGGVLLSRQGENWETVIENGTGGDGNDFTAVDATSDGTTVWAVGDSGAVARVSVESGDHVDLSAPNDLTSTWTGVAVAGQTDGETVYLANGSGLVLRGVMADGDMTWGEGQKPGSGSSIADLDFRSPQRGVFCDTGDGVFETSDGDAFDRIGIDDSSGTFTAVIAGRGDPKDNRDTTSTDNSESQRTIVAADDGSVHQHDRTGWTNDRPTDAALFGLAIGHGDRLAVGQGGTILAESGNGWETQSVPVDVPLRGAALLADGTALAVGDEGTLVERQPSTGGD